MGGLLEPYIDTQKGYKLYSPKGWNKFESDPGVYDVKFQDVIEPETTVQVSTSPVATATSVSALGDLPTVGAKFAKSRNAELVNAEESDVEGSLVYTFELKGELAPAALDDLSVPEDMDHIGGDVVQEPLVVGDEDEGVAAAAELVDAACDLPERVDVEA